jgi:uncharacterized pyridoxamine 5'-phosphate oxidase family protein
MVSGKIGYGTVSEALSYKVPFVFVRRDYFNEEPFLRNMLEVQLNPLFIVFFLSVITCFFNPKMWIVC